MGCGVSSLRGDDFPSINANAKPSYMRKISTPKPTAPVEHYEIAQEHERDLERFTSSQRRPSRPVYVDPDDLPMPPKTTHQHYHRRASENQAEPAAGWKERVKNMRNDVMTPSEQRGMGKNTGLTREEVLARGYPSRGSSGVIVPNGQRQRSFVA